MASRTKGTLASLYSPRASAGATVATPVRWSEVERGVASRVSRRAGGSRVPRPGEIMPMEAQLASSIPTGSEWQFEPKWDGFRCLAFRDGDEVHLMSKAAKPLSRYFPEVVATLRALPATRFVLDGELVVSMDGRISFDDLLLRIHPAESRITRLATESPAMLIVFDLLVDERGRSLIARPPKARRSSGSGEGGGPPRKASSTTSRRSPPSRSR